MSNYKDLYSLFLKQNEGKLHFACHSHHYWPDVTRDAQIQYWDDSAKYVDDKWSFFFQNLIPETSTLIAKILNLSQPSQIVFAPNTHEFVARLLSCFDHNKKLKILTTDSEFYSFDRQVNRLNENKNVSINKVPTFPSETFSQRMSFEINDNDYDLIFMSHVFFNSGLVNADFSKIVNSVKNSDTVIVIDGYHGFMAVPTDLKEIENRIFYIAGSYKYAQGGEGACFMHVPPNCNLRPENTGWFAELDKLADKKETVHYSNTGLRFAGATLDFTALYRLRASLNLFQDKGLSVEVIHSYVSELQYYFLDNLTNCGLINKDNLLRENEIIHGHFLTFKLPSKTRTIEYYNALKEVGIITDSREDRLRFGFSIYHDKKDVLSLITGLQKLAQMYKL